MIAASILVSSLTRPHGKANLRFICEITRHYAEALYDGFEDHQHDMGRFPITSSKRAIQLLM